MAQVKERLAAAKRNGTPVAEALTAFDVDEIGHTPARRAAPRGPDSPPGPCGHLHPAQTDGLALPQRPRPRSPDEQHLGEYLRCLGFRWWVTLRAYCGGWVTRWVRLARRGPGTRR
jgi:hypothetical protein